MIPPTWQSDCGTVKLWRGDCLEILPTWPAGCVDLVTDPPYGIGIAKNPFRQRFVPSDWDDRPPTKEAFCEISRVSDRQIIWGGNYFALPPSQGFVVWDKAQPEDFSSATCELAWCNVQRPARVYRYRVTEYAKNHPSQKPVELMIKCIEYISASLTIADPFMGSGTTGVAAVRLGRSFWGIEIDSKYFEIAKQRIINEMKLVKMSFGLANYGSQPKKKPVGFGLPMKKKRGKK